VLRGTPSETRERALELVAPLDTDDVLWVSDEPGDDTGRIEPVRPSSVRDRLGRSFDAVVLDVTRSLDADVWGQCHGFVWGGGALVLRLPPTGQSPTERRERLAVYPYEADDVGERFWHRIERAFEGDEVDASPAPLEPVPHEVRGTDQQTRAVERLAALFEQDRPARAVLMADRGRGKSSALGMALERYLDAAEVLDAVVTARHPDAAREVFQFALGTRDTSDDPPIPFVPAAELAERESTPDVLVVDEAAQLSIPLLKRLVDAHADARIAFASTTHGYEGTGRGFALRFLEWLDEQPEPLEVLELDEPIRWTSGDPLERRVFDALLLDAEPATLESPPDAIEDVEHVQLDRDALVRRPERLRQFFGLLIQAHYRTTPSDLRRMLDAPNLNLHALLRGGDVVAATWVAEEGALSGELCDDLYWGRQRILGHALPDTFVTHLGHRETGRMTMMRSVRIAVHPDLRRRGLGTRLVERVHEAYTPDLFGTLFGATPGLLRFRRSVGYEAVRLGVSRGSRTGAPSVAMMRPVSAWARDLFERCRKELALSLPVQLELMQAGRGLPIGERLETSLARDLPSSPELSEARQREIVAQFAWGPRTYESAAFALEPFVESHAAHLERLDDDQRRLVDAKIRRRRPWRQTVEAGSPESVPAAMRALRRAVRRLAETVIPSAKPDDA
jgi:tRNA(Met) cytidine acetyltransferase